MVSSSGSFVHTLKDEEEIYELLMNSKCIKLIVNNHFMRSVEKNMQLELTIEPSHGHGQCSKSIHGYKR